MLPFLRRKKTPEAIPWDRETMTPVIRCSICTGEKTAGFRRKSDGKIEEVGLIRDEEDLRQFRERYGISGDIENIY